MGSSGKQKGLRKWMKSVEQQDQKATWTIYVKMSIMECTLVKRRLILLVTQNIQRRFLYFAGNAGTTNGLFLNQKKNLEKTPLYLDQMCQEEKKELLEHVGNKNNKQLLNTTQMTSTPPPRQALKRSITDPPPYFPGGIMTEASPKEVRIVSEAHRTTPAEFVCPHCQNKISAIIQPITPRFSFEIPPPPILGQPPSTNPYMETLNTFTLNNPKLTFQAKEA